MPAQIAGHVFRGAYHAYEFRLLDSRAPVFVYDQARSGSAGRIYEAGERVYLSWAPEDSIIFDDAAQ